MRASTAGPRSQVPETGTFKQALQGASVGVCHSAGAPKGGDWVWVPGGAQTLVPSPPAPTSPSLDTPWQPYS